MRGDGQKRSPRGDGSDAYLPVYRLTFLHTLSDGADNLLCVSADAKIKSERKNDIVASSEPVKHVEV